jgi:glucose/arabinose dehydrogenase
MGKYLFLIGAVLHAGGLVASGALLDSNFSVSTFANVGGNLTGIAWAPDGSNRLFVSKKEGSIVIVENGSPVATPFATISPIFTDSECGLIGICFDPNFMVNGYVYVLVTVSSSEQQIIRYTAVGDTGVSKTILVGNLPTQGINHDGGGIGIGPDGKLYWSIGDNGVGNGVNADLTLLAAKVSRANLDGTVPGDNPFVDGPGGNNDYIWARGFRNPFTFTFHPVTGDLWLDCVGNSYEQIFLVRRGDHAGWNTYENNQPAGFITPKIKYKTNGTDTQTIASSSGAVRNGNVVTFTTTGVHGFRQGEKIAVTGVADSSFDGAFYVLSTPSPVTFTVAQAGPGGTSGGGTATTQNQGGCVTGGCFYDSTGVPLSYRENYFYGDYNSGRLMRAVINSTNGVDSVDYFATGSDSQIDIAIGPDGALYYGNLGGTINRLSYTNFGMQQIIVTPTVVRMVEGGTAAMTVRLAMAPVSDVTVNVARTSGDPDIDIADGSALTFTPANWSVPQVVQLEAAVDADSTDDTAGFTISASGLASEAATVHALDVPQGFSLQLIGLHPVQLRLIGQPGDSYVVEESGDLASGWMPLSTNLMTGTSTNITDPDPANLPVRFYRARLFSE